MFSDCCFSPTPRRTSNSSFATAQLKRRLSLMFWWSCEELGKTHIQSC